MSLPIHPGAPSSLPSRATARHRVCSSASALYADLDEHAGHLRRANEMKSRFLADVSHEFRVPINTILAIARLLLDRVDGELTSEQDKQVSFIRMAAESLAELVNELLDLAK